MKYEFTDPDGQIVEIDMPMRQAPTIGSIMLVEGRALTRIASAVQVDPGLNRHLYPYVSNTLPRNLEGCKTTGPGKPIVASKRHEREIMARHGYEKD